MHTLVFLSLVTMTTVMHRYLTSVTQSSLTSVDAQTAHISPGQFYIDHSLPSSCVHGVEHKVHTGLSSCGPKVLKAVKESNSKMKG